VSNNWEKKMKLNMKSALRGGVVAASAAVLVAAGATSASAQKGLDSIQSGDTGSAVRCVQAGLIGWGADLGGTGVDGQFGPKTQDAVIAFQNAFGLKPDGIVGSLTGDQLATYAEHWDPSCYYRLPTWGAGL
jgi:peptidoglycan hydrolase-like protein with peptidoglycan-binding domain